MNLELVKPKRLKIGDRVRIVAPSSPFEKRLLLKGIRKLEGMSLDVVFRKDIFAKSDYLAGSDRRRIEELHQAFEDKKCRGIFCARGGFGTTRILYHLDFNLIKKNPKVFVGFSDITALNLTFLSFCNFTTFHGPMIASQKFISMGKTEEEYFKRALFTTKTLIYKKSKNSLVLNRGRGTGEIIGGNLSMIHSMVGTKFLPCFNGKIVFFEDIGEAPFRVDRIFSHMFQLHLFDKVKGVVVGNFPNDKRRYQFGDQKLLKKIILDYFGFLKVPILFNFSAGHGRHNFILPIGVKAAIDTKKGELICQAGVCE